MMGPYAYEEARAQAPIHVQIRRFGAAPQQRSAEAVRVHGRIVRIFRDQEHVLHWWQRVSFAIPVIHRSRSPRPSGTIYHDWERMGRAHWLEVFLESWNGELQLVHSQVLAIRHPTWRPVCGPDAKGFICEGNF
ncbi:MAG: hypothetical protein WBQ26_13810 [Gemmatimonadaceae bacterium]|nr:hypothetical protein [Gemmatimonadaceae bacterium]